MYNLHILDYLEPVSLQELCQEGEYKDGQVGKSISTHDQDFPDLQQADIILVGCAEERGSGRYKKSFDGPNAIREQLYRLYYWHPDIKLVDVGNIKFGSTLSDTYAALKAVVMELTKIEKTVIILGGSHDLTLAQYYTYADRRKIVEVACIDALIDLNIDSVHKADQFLMEMLTSEPNYITHYNHIAFQSYFVHPGMLETMDKLRFDCFRVGHVKENIEEIEPVVRNSNLLSFDLSAISNAYAPAAAVSPNGLDGEEACTLMRYAGLSPNLNTIGLYGYNVEKDRDKLTARQISQMIWYFIDGRSRGKREARLDERDAFVEYRTAFAEVQTTFLQSKKTSRWWMQLPDLKYIACSYQDYLQASSNEIPERWLRAQERT